MKLDIHDLELVHVPAWESLRPNKVSILEVCEEFWTDGTVRCDQSVYQENTEVTKGLH